MNGIITLKWFDKSEVIHFFPLSVKNEWLIPFLIDITNDSVEIQQSVPCLKDSKRVN